MQSGSIEASVDVVELIGAETYLYLSIGTETVIARVDPSVSAKVGDKMTVVFDVSKIHIFDMATTQTISN